MKRLLVLLLAGLATGAFSQAALTVTNLSCERRSEPLGIDVAQPRLGWLLQSSERGERQTAYEIMVATTRALLDQNSGDVWTSGKVTGDATIQIPFDGKPLRSSQQVFWKARVWDAGGKVSTWSSPATWTMGLLAAADWQAKWIGAPTNSPSVLFRREFNVKPGLRRAVAHVCGLGHFEFFANGNRVGSDLLAPGWSFYHKTSLYDTHDVTALIRPGTNAVGLILGHGMYDIQGHRQRYVKFKQSFGPLKAIAQLQLDYADGTTEIIGTDSTWQTALSPITYDNVFAGEDFDARLVQKSWDQPAFKVTTNWSAATVTAGPGGTLKGLSCAAPPIRAIEVLQPIATNVLRANVTVYDLGQNAPIMPKLVVSGPAGSFVRIIPAELL
ncbi:MAG: alpha-L-rhamnosidase N-terminal domain-containing protein, partial [Akkermansiaceae bacterium]|nr:alpha-L-rhamnosidase N-terminal domain-containing protein [Verrucomicrobiales bacterium]